MQTSMLHVKNKRWTNDWETIEQIEEQREENDFQFMPRLWERERERARKVGVKIFMLRERNILIETDFVTFNLRLSWQITFRLGVFLTISIIYECFFMQSWANFLVRRFGRFLTVFVLLPFSIAGVIKLFQMGFRVCFRGLLASAILV